MGPSGFYKAPVTKVSMGVTMVGTAAAFFLKKQPLPGLGFSMFNKSQFHRIVSSQLFFASTGELLFGLMLMYQFRQFERRMGSAKFFSFIAWSTAFSVSFQLAFLVMFGKSHSLTPGPYSTIFSLFVYYYAHVPKLHRYNFWGFELSDKTMTYLLGSQLLLSGGASTLVPGICGFIGGLFAKSSLLPFHKLTPPKWLQRLAQQSIAPIVASSAPQDLAAASRIRGENRFQGVGGVPVGERLTGGPAGFGQQFEMMRQMAAQAQQQAQQPAAVDESAVENLVAMGFSRDASVQALRSSNNNVEQAANLLLAST